MVNFNFNVAFNGMCFWSLVKMMIDNRFLLGIYDCANLHHSHKWRRSHAKPSFIRILEVLHDDAIYSNKRRCRIRIEIVFWRSIRKISRSRMAHSTIKWEPFRTHRTMAHLERHNFPPHHSYGFDSKLCLAAVNVNDLQGRIWFCALILYFVEKYDFLHFRETYSWFLANNIAFSMNLSYIFR